MNFLEQKISSSPLITEEKRKPVMAFVKTWMDVDPEEAKFPDFLNYVYMGKNIPLGRKENRFHQEVIIIIRDIFKSQGCEDLSRNFDYYTSSN